jgi:hypothetical protein
MSWESARERVRNLKIAFVPETENAHVFIIIRFLELVVDVVFENNVTGRTSDRLFARG